jgi:hypothetical protein
VQRSIKKEGSLDSKEKKVSSKCLSQTSSPLGMSKWPKIPCIYRVSIALRLLQGTYRALQASGPEMPRVLTGTSVQGRFLPCTRAWRYPMLSVAVDSNVA